MNVHLEALKKSANIYYKYPKSMTIFNDELVERLYAFKAEQNPRTEEALLLCIDDLVMRIALQLKRKYSWVPRDAPQHMLYNTAFLGVRRACLKFEIKDEHSLYSFPTYMKGYILNEFSKEWNRKEPEGLRSHPVFLEYWRHTSDRDYNADARRRRAMINELLRTSGLRYDILTQVKMWADGWRYSEIGRAWLITTPGARQNILRAVKQMREANAYIQSDIKRGGGAWKKKSDLSGVPVKTC